jgi:hypothetical protein
MTAMYQKRSRQALTTAATKKNVHVYQKYGQSPKAQQRASKMQRELEELHAMAAQLCKLKAEK